MPPLWNGVILWNVLFLFAFQVRTEGQTVYESLIETHSKMHSTSSRVFVVFTWFLIYAFVTQYVTVTFRAERIRKKVQAFDLWK